MHYAIDLKMSRWTSMARRGSSALWHLPRRALDTEAGVIVVLRRTEFIVADIRCKEGLSRSLQLAGS
jgi:hypothetical protein